MGFPPMSFSLFGGDGSPNGPRAKSGDCHIAVGHGYGPRMTAARIAAKIVMDNRAD